MGSQNVAFRCGRVADHQIDVAVLQHLQRQAAASQVRARAKPVRPFEGRQQSVEQTRVAHAGGRGQDQRLYGGARARRQEEDTCQCD